MNQNFASFWYQFHCYIHDSWWRIALVPNLNSASSTQRKNLAYSQICEFLKVDKELPDQPPNIDMEFIYRLTAHPDQYLQLAGACLSVAPKIDFPDAWLMLEHDLKFAVQTCGALSLNQRFACQSESLPSPYEAGLLLLHAYLLSVDKMLWQRVRLCVDHEIEKQLSDPDGSFDLHQSVLKRLWKSVDLYISLSLKESSIVP